MPEMEQCQECGQEFPADEMYYTGEGGKLCRQCETSRDADEGFRKGYIGVGSGAASFALLSICFNVFMIPSILALVAGIQVFRYPKTIGSDGREAIDDLWWVPFLGGAGVVIGGGRTLLSALAIFAVL